MVRLVAFKLHGRYTVMEQSSGDYIRTGALSSLSALYQFRFNISILYALVSIFRDRLMVGCHDRLMLRKSYGDLTGWPLYS